jgi:hypothetical protein
VNLITALKLGAEAGAHLPAMKDILLIGIEAADVHTFDESLSADVEEALPAAVAAVMNALDS